MDRDLINVLAYAVGGGFLALIVVWFCGSLVLRLFGILNMIVAALMLIGFAAADLLYDQPAVWVSIGSTAAYGLAAWLGGHWLHARKYGWWKSRLAWRMLHPGSARRRTMVPR